MMAIPSPELLEHLSLVDEIGQKLREEFLRPQMDRVMSLMPYPGERNPFGDRVYFPKEPYDDGGGPALAAYRWAYCT